MSSIKRSNSGQRPARHNETMKLVLLGDQGVGKSSLVLRFVRGDFHEHQEATIGAAFMTQTINVQGHKIKFDIWDTAGQERYHSLAPMYYRGANAAIVVYDITSTHSFERAMTWIKELLQQSSVPDTIFLAGNKVDMAAGNRTVSQEEAASYAEANGLLFAETSAKTDSGVSDVFIAIAKSLATITGPSDGRSRTSGNVRLDQQNQGKKCC